jgi:hypothetical protein
LKRIGDQAIQEIRDVGAVHVVPGVRIVNELLADGCRQKIAIGLARERTVRKVRAAACRVIDSDHDLPRKIAAAKNNTKTIKNERRRSSRNDCGMDIPLFNPMKLHNRDAYELLRFLSFTYYLTGSQALKMGPRLAGRSMPLKTGDSGVFVIDGHSLREGKFL